MPWFDPKLSTTTDVVRAAIIPESAVPEPMALSQKLMCNKETLAQKMVTHCWANLFCNLVAAIVADAFDEKSYAAIIPRLAPDRIAELIQELDDLQLLESTYWVCALCVNQHKGICHRAYSFDTVTKEPSRTCNCNTPKFSSGVESEMNKFDAMMEYLSNEQEGFGQVIAVDGQFELFTRAWCIAELVEADQLQCEQFLKIHSDVDSNHRTQIQNLKIEECKASVKSDKDMILAKIHDFTTFNKKIRALVLDCMQEWTDATEQLDQVGRIIRVLRTHRKGEEPA
jgi:hypothetical protein